MKLSLDKKIRYILVTLLLFLINVPCVNAEDKIYQICDSNSGYLYLVKVDNTHNTINAGSFYTMVNNAGGITARTISGFKNPTAYPNVRTGYNNTISLGNGVTGTYAYGGYYHNNGDSRNTTRCYVKVSTEGNAQNGNAAVEPHLCGQSELINIGDGGINSGDIRINSEVNANGLTKVTISAASDYLRNNWGYVEVTSIKYAGAGNAHQNSLRGRVRRSGTSFIIDGIEPVEVRVDGNGNVVSGYGSGTFIVSLAIRNNDSTRKDSAATVASCGDWFYLGDFSTTIVDSGSLEVENTYKNSNQCNAVRSFDRASDEFKRDYIYECYNNKLPYSESIGAASTIESKYNTMLSIYGDLNVASGGLAHYEDLLCTSKDLGLPSDNDSTTVPFERKVTYEYSGTYWGMVCIQDYYIKSDDPQLVKGGMGVHYDNRVEINKTCYIYNKQVVQKKSQCALSVSEPLCADPGGITWADMTTGGPVEDFDSCVKKCDNGQYSQSCINKCYKQVYSSDRKLSFSSSKDDVVFKNKITKADKKSSCSFNSYNGSSCDEGISISCDPNSYCAGNGRNGTCNVVKDGQVLQSVCYSAWCNNHNGTSTECSVSWNVGPSGCSWSPESDYANELTASRNELSKLQDLMTQRSEIENYTIEFTDSKDGVIYKVSGNSREGASTASDEPRLVITEDNDKTRVVSSNTRSIQYGSEDSINVTDVVSHRTVYSISLPIQYSLKTDASTIIVKGARDNTYFTFNNNRGNTYLSDNGNAYYRFIRYDVRDNKLLSNGQNVFYTSLDSYEKNLKTYTSSGTTTTCGLSIGELVSGSSSETSTTGYYLFTNRDYVFYEINGVEILKTLEALEKNIKVSFSIESVGTQAQALGINNGEMHEFMDSGYSCYYGVINLLKGNETEDVRRVEQTLDCSNPGGGSDEPDSGPGQPSGGVAKGLRYYYREIYLRPNQNGYGGIFPNDREPRWNWTGTIRNGVASGAANNDDSSYIVDPEKLIEDIESKGDSIFTNEAEYDYVFTMTSDVIRRIREYNRSRIDGKRITYLDFSLVGASTDRTNFSRMVKEWYDGTGLYTEALNITDCNNAISRQCDY